MGCRPRLRRGSVLVQPVRDGCDRLSLVVSTRCLGTVAHGSCSHVPCAPRRGGADGAQGRNCDEVALPGCEHVAPWGRLVRCLA